MSARHSLGRWSFDPTEPVLRDGAEQRRLEDRAARTLEVLCARRGEVVGKDELLAAVWGGRTVSPNSVAVVIGALRRALEDDPGAPTLLLTVGKRGYRLEPAPATVRVDDAPRPPPTRPRRRAAAFVISAAAAALAALVATPLLLPPALTVRVEPARNDTGRPALDPLAAALGPVLVDAATRLPGVRVVTGSEAQGGERRIALRSRLILWNGAPELAMTEVDLRSGAVLWSGFAAGPTGALARAASAQLAASERFLRPAAGGHGFFSRS